MPIVNKNIGLVIEDGKRIRPNLLLFPFALLSIYSLIIPIVILDFSVSLYQLIYFTAMEIPKISKKQFVVMERWDLSKLTFLQKINCVYCEYTNGILAYAKAVGNQTEIYSCAIKHRHALKHHKHEKDFYPEKLFD